jgi:ribosomal protein S7
MNDDPRQHARRAMERDEVRAAITRSGATESIGRKLGDELITASREAIAAWHERRNSEHRMAKAIARLEELVGKP